MKKWVFIALIIQALLIAALTAVMYFVPVQLEWVSSSSETPPATIARTPEDAARDFEPMTEEEWQEFEIRWANAPEEIRELARRIAQGETPSATELEGVGAEALSKGYPAQELDREWDGTFVAWQSTLLKEAVWAYNLPATQALLAAGADPNVDHGSVLFIAIRQRTRGAPNFSAFPDFDEMTPFLHAYLEAGANPNVQEFGFRTTTPIDDAYGENNLAAMLLLLEFQADPWLKMPDQEGYVPESLMESLASSSSNGAVAEILFRLARSGHLPKGPDDQLDEVYRQMESKFERLDDEPGPRSRHRAWRFDQLFFWLGSAFDQPEKYQNLRKRLPAFDYQADGGWYLAEGEVHSPPDEPLVLPDGGTEIWGP